MSTPDKEGMVSTLTVREVMTLAPLHGAYVLAGQAGLDRTVSGANVMEVPDIESYVKAGELLLTTGYPVHERPERLVEMLPALASRGLAALAIKPLRYLGQLPDRLISEAERLNFPVLVLPDHTSFNEVIGAVLAVVLAEYGAEPGGAEIIRERLTGVALTGGGLEEIARTLAVTLDREVTIVDREDAVLGRGAPRHEPGAWNQDETVESAAPWAFPITVAGARRGQILVGGSGEPTLGQRRLVRQSCFAAGMHIAQALASLELDRRLRALFLEELVTGPSIDEPMLRQRSRLFGWDLSSEHVVLLARCSSELSDAQIAGAAQRTLPAGALAWSRGQEVVAVVPARDRGPVSAGRCVVGEPAFEERWRCALLDLAPDGVAVAVGPVVREPRDLAASHTAAREALTIARRTGRKVVRHDELVLERLLLAVPGDLLRDLVAREIGALIAHDAEVGGDLCRTLAAYLGVGNGAEAARRLYVHYNTVKHRLARITELTGADLHDPSTRLRLALALEAHTLL
jgi:purine catabolism regulator